MKDRLQLFLDHEQLSPAKLADILGVQRSGLSHILSGRNKPGFDLIQKLLTKFPHLNAEWLITGKGELYKENLDTKLKNQPSTLFQTQDLKNDARVAINAGIEEDIPVKQHSQRHEIAINESDSTIANKKKILKRIIMIYSDNTFNEFLPGETI